MAKSVKFKSNSEDAIAVIIGGPGTIIRLKPGEVYETDDPREVASLKANSDMSEVKAKAAKKDAKKDAK